MTICLKILKTNISVTVGVREGKERKMERKKDKNIQRRTERNVKTKVEAIAVLKNSAII